MSSVRPTVTAPPASAGSFSVPAAQVLGPQVARLTATSSVGSCGAGATGGHRPTSQHAAWPPSANEQPLRPARLGRSRGVVSPGAPLVTDAGEGPSSPSRSRRPLGEIQASATIRPACSEPPGCGLQLRKFQQHCSMRSSSPSQQQALHGSHVVEIQASSAPGPPGELLGPPNPLPPPPPPLPVARPADHATACLSQLQEQLAETCSALEVATRPDSLYRSLLEAPQMGELLATVREVCAQSGEWRSSRTTTEDYLAELSRMCEARLEDVADRTEAAELHCERLARELCAERDQWRAGVADLRAELRAEISERDCGSDLCVELSADLADFRVSIGQEIAILSRRLSEQPSTLDEGVACERLTREFSAERNRWRVDITELGAELRAEISESSCGAKLRAELSAELAEFRACIEQEVDVLSRRFSELPSALDEGLIRLRNLTLSSHYFLPEKAQSLAPDQAADSFEPRCGSPWQSVESPQDKLPQSCGTCPELLREATEAEALTPTTAGRQAASLHNVEDDGSGREAASSSDADDDAPGSPALSSCCPSSARPASADTARLEAQRGALLDELDACFAASVQALRREVAEAAAGREGASQSSCSDSGRCLPESQAEA